MPRPPTRRIFLARRSGVRFSGGLLPHDWWQIALKLLLVSLLALGQVFWGGRRTSETSCPRRSAAPPPPSRRRESRLGEGLR